MQNAIDALDSSTDNFSDRSGLGILPCHKEEGSNTLVVSPPPTLHVESESADDNHTSDIGVMASKILSVNDRPRTRRSHVQVTFVQN